MLEDPSLWLSGPTAAWPPGLPRTAPLLRHVLAADTREPRGHVAITPGRWWLKRMWIAAYEMPDASLVFTARRSNWLSSTTTVSDADGNTVTQIAGDAIFDTARQLLAHRRGDNWRVGSFVNQPGLELMRWGPERSGTIVDFADSVRNQPLVRMGLLAAIIVNS